jgi:CheY-like chemotaxis protein
MQPANRFSTHCQSHLRIYVGGVKLEIQVLIAEDNRDEALLVRRAISKVDPAASFFIVSDGREAMQYLKGDGEFKDRAKFPFPRVLILDLKMPVMDGFELMDWLLKHPDCNVIPKIVLSASNLTEDVIKAYQLGANIFFQKPSDYNELVAIIELNFRIWSLAELPPNNIMACS